MLCSYCAENAPNVTSEILRPVVSRLFPNVTDAELVNLYAAADIYMNHSLWEGYNLGIGQALAIGTSGYRFDIPAHREFGVFTSNNPNEIVSRLAELATILCIGISSPNETARVWAWDEPLGQLATAVETLCAEDDLRVPDPGGNKQSSDAGCS